MSFNPQAVLLYSPPSYPTHVEVDGNVYELRASHQANGNYSFNTVMPYEQREKLLPVFKMHGLPGLSRSQTAMADVRKMMALLDARINEHSTDLQTQGAAYVAFLQAQLDSHKPPAPSAEFVQARDSFIQMATELLQAIQKTHFRGYAIRELVYPVQSIALSKQRNGIFLWPDWEDARYVNLVCSCTEDDRRELREVIHDWAETMRLRINTGVHF